MSSFLFIYCVTLSAHRQLFFWLDDGGDRYAYSIVSCVCMAILAFFSFLDGFVGFCAGCFFFGLAVRFGIISSDPSKDCDKIAEEHDFTMNYQRQRLGEGPSSRVIKVCQQLFPKKCTIEYNNN